MQSYGQAWERQTLGFYLYRSANTASRIQKDPDDYKGAADEFNRIGAAAKGGTCVSAPQPWLRTSADKQRNSIALIRIIQIRVRVL